MKYGDALTAPFWDAAERRELVLQQCRACGSYQFYPRPFCLSCDADSVTWVRASGLGRIVTQTTVYIEVTPEWTPPYVVAIVQLDEGPCLLTNILGGACKIGDRVRVAWRGRTGAPPFPIFEPLEE